MVDILSRPQCVKYVGIGFAVMLMHSPVPMNNTDMIAAQVQVSQRGHLVDEFWDLWKVIVSEI